MKAAAHVTLFYLDIVTIPTSFSPRPPPRPPQPETHSQRFNIPARDSSYSVPLTAKDAFFI